MFLEATMREQFRRLQFWLLLGLVIILLVTALVIYWNPIQVNQGGGASIPGPGQSGLRFLEVQTGETPLWQQLPNGTSEIRFTRPVTIRSNYVIGLSYHSGPEMLPKGGEVSIQSENKSVRLEKLGAHIIALMQRDADGEINPLIRHKLLIIIGDWPEPIEPRRDKPLPEGVELM